MKRLVSLLLLVYPALLMAGDWSGYWAVEGRAFFEEPKDPEQENANLSFSVEPEYYHKSEDGKNRFVFKPFLRWDQHDKQRTHADIREMHWTYVDEGYSARVGIGKEFWGVTEALHLVDIINQTDMVENPDGEQKLGQPMAKLAFYPQDFGALELFMLPGFRERTFPGKVGRFRSHPRVDEDEAFYLTGSQHHMDWAARWSNTWEMFDWGLSWFKGIGRDPMFTSGLNSTGEYVLVPYYEIIEQTSLDAQMTLGAWAWKLEAIDRTTWRDHYYALTGGFEVTQANILDTGGDVGLLVEAMYDQREDNATTPFNHDMFYGVRWTANDEQSTELLFGLVEDWRTGSKLWNLEASRRIGQDMKLSIQSRGWYDMSRRDLMRPLAYDDYIQIEIAKYF